MPLRYHQTNFDFRSTEYGEIPTVTMALHSLERSQIRSAEPAMAMLSMETKLTTTMTCCTLPSLVAMQFRGPMAPLGTLLHLTTLSPHYSPLAIGSSHALVAAVAVVALLLLRVAAVAGQDTAKELHAVVMMTALTILLVNRGSAPSELWGEPETDEGI